MTLVEKILEIMKEVQYLAKDTKVEYKNTKYKALSEEKVTSIMREQMIKHKIVVYPIEQMFTRFEHIPSSPQDTSTNAISHVDVTYRMVNVEDPKDYIDIVSAGDGADTQDKGSGKAMTYAYKYMWLRTFGIPTGEDPDKISSEELDDNLKEATKAKIVSPKVKITSAVKEDVHLCTECGRPIEDSKKTDGSVWSAKEIAAYTMRRFGKELCVDCGKEESKKNA